MGTNTFVDIDIPEAEALAGYSGIETDIESAQQFAKRLLEERSKPSPDWALVEPLTIATLVQYARPFVTGVRIRLGEDALAVLSPRQREKHDWLYAVRDKHIAHPVNAFEENQPVARYWAERVHQEGIEQVQCIKHRIIGLSVQDLHDIVDLTIALLRFVQDRLKEEKAKVLCVVRGMPIDAVLEGGAKTPSPVAPDPTKRRRKLGP